MGKAIAELRDQTDQELDMKLGELRKEIYTFRNQTLEKKAKETHLIGKKRKEIARILTIKRERELQR